MFPESTLHIPSGDFPLLPSDLERSIPCRGFWIIGFLFWEEDEPHFVVVLLFFRHKLVERTQPLGLGAEIHEVSFQLVESMLGPKCK